MKKIYICLIAVFVFNCLISAQDIITKKDGTDIQAKVTEVDKSHVSYKNLSNLNGPTYKVDISDILMITYENGYREMYVEKETNRESYSVNVNGDIKIKKDLLPQGVMTYDSWSGKIFVGGQPIEDELLTKYFSYENYNRYRQGKVSYITGGIVGIICAVPFGWSIGTMIAGEAPNIPLFVSSSSFFVGGYVAMFIGRHKMKQAINNYNSSLAFQPELRYGLTNNGICLAIIF